MRYLLPILTTIFLSSSLAAEDKVDPEADFDRIYMTKMHAMDKYRLSQGDVVNRALLTKSMRDVGVLLLDECLYNSRRSCRQLIKMLTKKRVKPTTKCYGVMIAGYMCDIHKDLEACQIYKRHESYCKNLEAMRP